MGQSPDLRVAAFASMSLAPPKPERQSSADCGSPSPRQKKKSATKDQENAQLVVSALDLAVEERRLAEFRTRCRLQAYFPEAESQGRRQAERNKLVCYFPDLQASQNRRNFRKKNLLNCMFPNFEDTPRNGEKHSLQAKCPTPVAVQSGRGSSARWRRAASV